MELNGSAARAYREGRLLDCHELLLRLPTKSDSEAALAAELLNLLGRADDAEAAASRLVGTNGLPDALLAKCTSVLADCRWYGGELSTGLELYKLAVRRAEASKDVSTICRANTQLLERTCDSTGFDSSLPLASVVRRSVTRSDDPQVHSLVHLAFGRLEAKAGRFAVAQRHFHLARGLLASDPNVYLASSIDLDESVALWLTGDIASAIDLAERGAIVAARIGWSRGRVAAGANLACLYVCSGRVEDAHKQIRLASLESFSSPSFQLALADTKARALLASGDYAAAETTLEANQNELQVQPWYTLTSEQTRIELLLRMRRWREALDRLDTCITRAREAKLHTLLTAFQLARSEALVESEAFPDLNDLPLSQSHESWPLGLVGGFHAVLGKALDRALQRNRGASHKARAIRVLEGAGDLMAAKHIGESSLTDAQSGPGGTTAVMGFGHLDSAVALLELSGHPHILGREAFAILQDTGCAEALALGRRSTRGVRLVACDGWTEAEALAALRTAGQDDLILMGQHRDETWEILARPRPELDHRCTLAAIRKLVATARALDQYRRDEKQRAALWPAEALEGDAESLWISEQSTELLHIARRIASSPLPILLTGETGTGKEMLARVIHRASDRADRPLVPFNCTAVPRDMLESQLFGYRKGAFTGADTSFAGVIRSASGGTLFLDEIGDIGIELQPKLLRFIEQREVHPLGEAQPVKVDVRIIAATNANLDQLVAQGRFREDLLYRLKILPLHLPPLRERREEIPALLQHYMQKFGDEQRKGRVTLSDETLEYLLLYAWPGNIRQLANEVRRMIALAEADATVTPALLSPEIRASRRTVPAADAPAEPEIRLRLDQPLPVAVDALEQTLVRHALQRSHGRVEEAARILGISRKGLFLKRRRWGLQQAS
jgi:DNA-binding NtrC family response regulator